MKIENHFYPSLITDLKKQRDLKRKKEKKAKIHFNMVQFQIVFFFLNIIKEHKNKIRFKHRLSIYIYKTNQYNMMQYIILHSFTTCD